MEATARHVDSDLQRWEAAIGELLAEAGATGDHGTKVDCLREAAAIYERQLGDLPRALVAWQAAFAEDPGREDSALAIERIADALGCWSVILPECEELLADVTYPGPRAALLTWLARWMERAAGDEEAAEQRLEEALALAPSFADAAEALSALHRKRGDWSRAAEVLVAAGTASSDPQEAVGLLLDAARIIHNRVGDAEAAMQLYRQVLALDPQNALAAEALAETSGAVLDPEAVCVRYRQALDIDPENLNVMRQWAEVALQHGRLDDLRLLFDLLFRRAGGSPGSQRGNRARLNEALDRFVAAEKWPEAIDVLHTLARESEGALAAKYFVAAGKIAQHECKDHHLAIELYERALDLDPEDTRTFDRVHDMLAAAQAWSQAEAALGRMIGRLRNAGKGEQSEVMIPLWRRLGDVRRTGTRDMAAASEAYRECARLAPEDRYARLVADITARQPARA
jgi:tetratricopeptide (TPR) repeat protein